MQRKLPKLKKIEAILKLVLENPSWGSHTISGRLPKIKGKPLLSNRGVYKILVQLNLETRKKRRAFVHLNRRVGRKTVSEILANWFVLAGKKRLSARERLTTISRVEMGEPVRAICSFFGISRKNFYKWRKRYKEAPQDKKESALVDKRPEIERYWRQIPEEQEKKVLEIILSYPELSAHKIVQVLPRIAGKPIIGNHGVQNILRRNKLSIFEARLAYQKAHLVKPILPPLPTQFQPIFNLSSRVLRMAIAPFATIPKQSWFKVGSFTFLSTFVLSTSARLWLLMFKQAPVENRTGLIFATISILCGSFFFLYSLKYYLTLALVLGFSRQVGKNGGNGGGINGNHNNHHNNSNGKMLWLTRFFGGNGNGNGNGRGYTGGLQPNLDHIKLEREPFVSIHLPLYNEKKVVDRLLTACTSMDYENYEVIVVDDSTDGTIRILKDWKNHPRVKIIHRESREGFKGGALKVALENADPKTEFVIVFDADFIPYPDTITQFLKYFKNVVGSLIPGDSKVACVQGYQWHVLNKSENWITRGVRSEYAGSYVVERSGTEVLGALKQIAGSVYMLRADLLRKYGWGTSITEDFQLTLRLYEQGYKVVYTPYVQVPSECVATIKRLIRQRMRWAEGHSYNIRKLAFRLLASRNLNLIEKLELLYLSPYYLQAFFFMIGTLSWLISETVFRARLPFWTSLWGWSLVLTNMFSLPLMNTVGLFLEESEEKDYLGILSFVALSYLLVPFQAYASVKGFLEFQEGPWFRTPKTGKITDIFTRGKFYRWISGIIPGRRPAPALAQASAGKQAFTNPYLALATANNRFENFQIKPKRLPWLAKSTLAILLALTTTLLYFARDAQLVYANTWDSPLQLMTTTGESGTSFPAWGNWLTNQNSYSTGNHKVMRFINANGTTNNYFWLSNLWPNGTGYNNATIPSGNYYVQFAKSGNGSMSGPTNTINVAMQLLLTNNNGTARVQLAINTYVLNGNNNSNELWQFSIGNITGNNISWAAKNRLAIRLWARNVSNTGNRNIFFNLLTNNSGAPIRLIIPAGIIIPEVSKPVMMAILMVIIPVMPALVSGRFRRPGGNIFQEFRDAWKDLLKRLLGEETALDELPV